MKRSLERVRYAVVGLGHIAQAAVIPAFAHAKKAATLTALVSGDDRKRDELGRRYRVPICIGYADYDNLLLSGEIHAVYIALPNSQHRDFALRAARAGVHVLCEKPLAMSAKDCLAMIAAAEANDVKLMTAYRLHFERANMSAIEAVRSGKLGEPRFFNSLFGMNVTDEDNIRLDSRLGGGPLFDLGVYCVNAARYLFRDEPEEVFAMNAVKGNRRFRDVPEMTSVLLRFPKDRLATLTCSFGSADVSSYRLVGTKGSLGLEPAYEYAEGLNLCVTVGERTVSRSYPKRDQFAPELTYFAECILENREPEPSGWEGYADCRVIDAALRSARTGRSVALAPLVKRIRPTLRQVEYRPPARKKEEIRARSPHADSSKAKNARKS